MMNMKAEMKISAFCHFSDGTVEKKLISAPGACFPGGGR
jgi:hypothetical protein